jgi:ribosomal protein S18 acetylase RimI-like enzyme
VGRALAGAALRAAVELGYERVRLDTTAEMVGAIRIYEGLGFAPIAAYRHNPLEGARYFEVRLEAVPGTLRPASPPRPDPEAPQR